MSRFTEYAHNAAEFAAPYVREAGDYAQSAVQSVEKGWRRRVKRVKRKHAFAKISNALDILANIILLIAAVLALFMVIKENGTKKEK